MNDNNSSDLIVHDKKSIAAVDIIRKAITKKHKSVSNKTTPKPFVKKKMGMDYCEYSYMRDIADQEFPGWSWTIVKTEVLGSEAYVVHGRLSGTMKEYGEKVTCVQLIGFRRKEELMNL